MLSNEELMTVLRQINSDGDKKRPRSTVWPLKV